MISKVGKIFLAGHTGLVGSAILKSLQKNNYKNIVTRSSRDLDLTDCERVKEFFMNEKPDYVFLAAAKVGGIVANNKYRADFIYQNLQIQNNIIVNSWKAGVKKLIFLGSSCIYPKNSPQPLKEEYLLTSELEYTNEPYAIAKIAGIKMCEAFNLQYGTNFICVMPTNLFGFSDNFDLEKSHVLPAVIRKLYLGKNLMENNMHVVRKDLSRYPIENIDGDAMESVIVNILEKYGIIATKSGATVQFWGTGQAKRDFLFSDDLADALIFIFENLDFNDLTDRTPEGKLKQIKNTHLNIGTGKDIYINELVNLVAGIIGFKGSIEWDINQPDGTSQKLMDISKINSLGWKAKTSLEEGINLVYDWYVRQ